MEYLTITSLISDILRVGAVILSLLTIIFVHEFGHYIIARLCSIKVQIFSIGFGKPIWKFHDKNGTCWQLAAIPLGGYIRFTEEGDKNFAQQSGQSFNKAAPVKQAATVFGGPFFNILFTLSLFTGLYLWAPPLIVEPIIGEVVANSPANKAGLLPGDKIIELNKKTISSFSQIREMILANKEEPLSLRIERQAQIFELSLKPQAVYVQQGAQGGKIYQIGIKEPQDPEHPGMVDPHYIKRPVYGFRQAVGEAISDIEEISRATLSFLGKLILGKGDRCNISGPTKTINIAWQLSAFGPLVMMRFVAFLSLSLAIINLLPIPPLDGGQLVFHLYEMVLKRPIPNSIKNGLMVLGAILVLLVMILSFINDYIPC